MGKGNRVRGVIDAIVAIVALLFLLGALLLIPLMVKGDGSKGIGTGVPVKLSYKGWIFKTWEGELMLGGIDAKNGVPYVWEFSVCDKNKKDVIEVLNKAMNEHKLVAIEYVSPVIGWKWKQKTKYCVDSVKVIEN